MNTGLKEQLDQIADQTVSGNVSVIVQMDLGKDLRKFLQATSEAINLRRSVVSARALVPPPREKLMASNRGGSSRGPIGQSMRTSGFVASRMFEILKHEDIRQAGEDALKPLCESDFYNQIDSNSRLAKPVPLWMSGSMVLEVAREKLIDLKSIPGVVGVYSNRQVRVPPIFRAQEEPNAVKDNKGYTWGLSRTGAMSCWGAFGAKGKGVKVAVLDTGVDPTHPDIEGKLDAFAEFDANGMKVEDQVTKAYDSDCHGTHVSGVIAGSNASGRLIGMAPEAKLISALVLKKGFGTDAQVLAGLQWAIDNHADVICMSLGGLRLSADVLDTYTSGIIAANRLGVPVIVSVGNEGSQTTSSPGNDYFAFTVGATDVDDLAAGFSGGRTQVVEKSRYIESQFLPVVYSKPDVTAPGVDIFSAVPDKKWESWNGTSMAAPHVAGAMALLLSKPLNIKDVEGFQRTNLLQSLLMSTGRQLGESGQNHRFGYVRIDVLRAYGYAVELGYKESESV